MATTEVTRENWFSRILDSIKGIVFGLFIFVLAFPLLIWNEYRAVQTAQGLAAGKSAVVSVEPDTIDANFNDKLVHVNGQATTSETLSDSTFGVSEQAIKLERTVEMFQWQENQETETRKKTGGSEEKVTTYTYEKVWGEQPISSSKFKEAAEHQNPASMPYESKKWTSESVTVGKFKLADSLVRKISAWESYPVSDTNIAMSAPSVKPDLKVVEGRYYLGEEPSNPQIGDLRIGFQLVKPTEVSIVAAQNAAKLQAWEPPTGGYEVELLESGQHTADEMFASAEAANTTMSWILRLVGFVAMFAGLFLLGRPFAVVADFIPAIGAFFRVGIGLFAFLIAGGASLITIAVSWLAFRPLLGFALLTVGALMLVGLVFLALTIGRKGKGEPEEAAAA